MLEGKRVLEERVSVLQSVLSGVGNPILVYNSEERIVWLNDLAVKWFGASNAAEAITRIPLENRDTNQHIVVQIADEGTQIAITVSDNGPGFPPSSIEQEHPFDTSFTDKPTGTGQGLLIIKRIIEGHNGSIELDSKPGNTLVRILLPKA